MTTANVDADAAETLWRESAPLIIADDLPIATVDADRVVGPHFHETFCTLNRPREKGADSLLGLLVSETARPGFIVIRALARDNLAGVVQLHGPPDLARRVDGALRPWNGRLGNVWVEYVGHRWPPEPHPRGPLPRWSVFSCEPWVVVS